MYENHILQYLFDNNSAGRVDLLDYFLNKYPEPSEFQLRDINTALKNLHEKKFIELSTQDFFRLGNQSSFPNPYENRNVSYDCTNFKDLLDAKIRNVTQHPFTCRILEEGIREINNSRLQQQIIEVNESVRKTNVSIIQLNGKTIDNFLTQRNLTYAIFLATAVSAVAAVIPICNPTKTNFDKSILDTLQTMRKKVIELEQNQQSQSKIEIPLPVTVRLDSLTNAKNQSIAPSKY